MKLATVRYDEKKYVGVIDGERAFLISGPGFPTSMKALILGGEEMLQSVREAVVGGRFSGVGLNRVKLLAPLPDPQKIMAIGLNYYDHCREQNVQVPKSPIVFAKFPSSIIGPGDAITWSAQLTDQVDLEVELGVIIGKQARRVSEEQALDYVFGYTVLNDVSARDLQYGDKQFVRGKSLDTFCPIGPWIVTADEIADPQALHLSSRVNDVVMQNSSTSEMIFSVRHLISFMSQAFTLEPGDLIATGTPDGVGMYRKPQVFLKNGDLLTLEVEKIGELVNPTHIAA
jgi:2-keto-4-pentenoate hydratase/2-oxohepta-3-ene-1,7-dioic acid hydratase in catechol pathway